MNLVHTRRAWIELDPVRFERDTVERHPCNAGRDHLKKQLVVHAVGGLMILLVATALSIFKPWGKTAYGRRRAT